jgi:hypothetical protein
MKVLIKSEYSNHMITRDLTGEELGVFLGVIGNVVIVDQKYVDGKYIYENTQNKQPEIVIVPENSGLFNDNQQEVLFTENKELQERNSKLWTEKYTLEKKVAELEKNLATIRESVAPEVTNVTC